MSSAKDVQLGETLAMLVKRAGSSLIRAEEITTTMTRQTNEMTTLLSDKSGGVLASIVEKGQQFSDNLTQATEQAVKAIETETSTSSPADEISPTAWPL